MCWKDSLVLSDQVVRFVAENIRSSVRDLEGSLIKLIAYASLKHREITVDLAREALRDKLQSLGGESTDEVGLTIAVIQQTVAKDWGITVDGLKSKTRTRTLTVPRQVAMYLCRELLSLQLVEIGNAFGGRDHSTVIHSLERASAAIADSVAFATRVDKLRSVLETMRA